MFPTWSDWDFKYTRKGLFKKSVSAAVKSIALLAMLYTIGKQKQKGMGLRAQMRSVVQHVMWTCSALLKAAGNKV